MFKSKILNDIDNKIIHIMKNGILCSFIICLIASIVLCIYNINGVIINFYIGIQLLKSSFIFIISFIIGGIAFNRIINEIN